MKDLGKLRGRIDKIDLEILKLLEKRWKITKEIGGTKRKKKVRYYDPERERKVIKNVTKKTVLDKKFVKKIFTNITEHCRNGESE